MVVVGGGGRWLVVVVEVVVGGGGGGWWWWWSACVSVCVSVCSPGGGEWEGGEGERAMMVSHEDADWNYNCDAESDYFIE